MYRITVYGSVFGLLNRLISLKSSESPALLKTILTTMFDVMRDKERRCRLTEEFAFRNFIQIFEEYPEIPIFVLVDPLTVIFSDRIKGERK